MYNWAQLTKKYLHYYFTASNGKGHGIHSPYMFDFVTNVLNDKRHFYAYQTMEALRHQLCKDKTILEVEDFGAGSVTGKSKRRSVASIARTSVKSKKLSQLLFRVVHYYQPKTILELGTSLGISSAYMASANPNARVITIEGAVSVSKVATFYHQWLQLNNIEIITGRFEDKLPGILQSIDSIDFAFIDGNHRLEPTKDYFQQLLLKSTTHSIFIFDDIHWSSEMEEAWNFIRQHSSVTATIDLFFFGIVLFRPEFKSKQHFVIRF
jgi:predicted O-methyltransferase YrrM